MSLAICKKIVQNCGGTIDVFSQGEDKGSTLVFSIKMRIPKSKSESKDEAAQIEVI